ncbi:MAG: EAL domain-containing protein [Synergistaceae bacterium]|nr:EAL domain-containing protein [Synergistaceae bacterium]
MTAYKTETKDTSADNQKTARSKTRINSIILTVIVLLIVSLHLRFAWYRYNDIASSEAVMLAQSMESLLHPEHISELSGTEKDLDNPAYIMTKLSLQKLVETNNPIRFAYLLGEDNGSMIFLIDSESPDSPNYSPPGQIYEEAGETDWLPFKTAKTVLTEPTTDRWGTWISALVPIKDPADGRVIAVLGLDYSASQWNDRIWERMIPDIVIVISLLILFLVMLRTWNQHSLLIKLNKKMAFNEALYRSVFEQAPIGIAIADENRYVSQSEYGQMNANPMFEQIIGWKNEDLSKINWTDITHQEDLNLNIKKYEEFKEGKTGGYSIEKRFIKPDGSTVWTNMKVSPLLGYSDVRSYHLCLLEDISARKAAEESLKESERSKSVLLSHLPGMAYRCSYDPDWTMHFVSDGCMELTGYSPESLLNNRDLSFNDLIAPEYSDRLWNEWKRILADRLPFKHEYEIITAEGKRKWVLELAEGIFNDQCEVEALEGIIIDISDRKEVENLLRYTNEHDRWTGLFNRYYLENMLKHDAGKDFYEKRALISINLGSVQSLTRVYGFHYTQDLIKKTANAFSEYSTDKRILFSTYENRFVYYMKGYKDRNELLEFTEILIEILESLLATERIGGGIGIMELGSYDDIDVDTLLKKLLIASEKAIKIYDDNFGACFYDEEMEIEIIREQDIKSELARIAAGENIETLFLQFQPIIDLKSDKIKGFEALARMKNEKLGLVPPLEFIPVAEKTKLIIPIGYIIFMQSFRFLNRLKEIGCEDINISVNVSAVQVLEKDFSLKLFKIIKEMQVDPKNIIVEITESVFSSNYEDINKILGELRNSGIKIAIDDFGTGYSSLAREQELNVDCLKIDKYFIDKLLEVNPDYAITAEVISMAHKMGHYVTAEGVEYENQKEYLIKNGCDSFQGYLFARPLDEDEAVKILIKEKNIDQNTEI